MKPGPKPRVPAERLAALRAEGLSFPEIDRRVGYAPGTGSLSRRRLVGAGLHVPAKQRRYTEADRAAALRLARAGRDDSAIASRLGIDRGMVRRWRVAAGLPAQPQARKAPADAPCREGCGRLRSENTLRCYACDRRRLREGTCGACGKVRYKTGCPACDLAGPSTGPASPAVRRRALAFIRRNSHSFAEIAGIVGVDKNTLYKWRRQARERAR